MDTSLLATPLWGLGCETVDRCSTASLHRFFRGIQGLGLYHQPPPNGDRLDRLDSAVAIFRNTQCPDLNTELGLRQRTLDGAASQHRLDDLFTHANQVDRARLLAATAPNSGAWLSAIPVESLGLLLPDDAQNLGRLPRHAALNDVVYRALAAAVIVATLEHRDLDRGDGRRLDGITVFPFRRGKMLIGSRRGQRRKRRRYEDLARKYDFSPLTVETSGVLGSDFSDLLDDIGRRITQRSGEPRETAWLRQRISLAVARGNAAAICEPH
ncbi:hypothetical protein E2C01_087357 [Portunus trituberculatus]|uniref:Uncharacterized protein n=1 Tax=Portunus trituberculatus TaxID=210409 RepID=A0A5B7JH19_PORTR|nr:hypothetical protein [Portunus trituberculatus]